MARIDLKVWFESDLNCVRILDLETNVVCTVFGNLQRNKSMTQSWALFEHKSVI